MALNRLNKKFIFLTFFILFIMDSNVSFSAKKSNLEQYRRNIGKQHYKNTETIPKFTMPCSRINCQKALPYFTLLLLATTLGNMNTVSGNAESQITKNNESTIPENELNMHNPINETNINFVDNTSLPIDFIQSSILSNQIATEIALYVGSLNKTEESLPQNQTNYPNQNKDDNTITTEPSSFIDVEPNDGSNARLLTKEAQELSDSFHSILTCLASSDTHFQFNTPDNHYVLSIKDQFVDYSIDQISTFYKDIKHIGGGGEHSIYKVTIKENRNELDAGTNIALRVRLSVPKDKPRSIHWSIIAYSKLEQLKRLQISNYIPPYYDFYYAPCLPEIDPQYRTTSDTMMYTEMELMDTTYEKEYIKKNNPVTARVICEELLGKWAWQKIAKIYVSDDKIRQYGLKWDDDYLVYHIGKKSYIFEPGYSPRRLDLDIFSTYTEETSRAPFWWNERYDNFLYTRAQSQNLKKLYEEINTKGLFESIEDNLQEFEVSENNPIPPKGVKHLYISEDMLAL